MAGMVGSVVVAAGDAAPSEPHPAMQRAHTSPRPTSPIQWTMMLGRWELPFGSHHAHLGVTTVEAEVGSCGNAVGPIRAVHDAVSFGLPSVVAERRIAAEEHRALWSARAVWEVVEAVLVATPSPSRVRDDTNRRGPGFLITVLVATRGLQPRRTAPETTRRTHQRPRPRSHHRC